MTSFVKDLNSHVILIVIAWIFFYSAQIELHLLSSSMNLSVIPCVDFCLLFTYTCWKLWVICCLYSIQPSNSSVCRLYIFMWLVFLCSLCIDKCTLTFYLIIYRSELRQLNFRGFYTILLFGVRTLSLRRVWEQQQLWTSYVVPSWIRERPWSSLPWTQGAPASQMWNATRDGQPTTFWQCSALHPHPLPSSWWRAAFYLSLGVVVRLPRPCATTFLGPRRAGRPPRVCGKKFAELPLIGTRVQYRRQGMCRLLMNEVEKLLSGLGVERLLLPTVPQLLETWTGSFGFTEMSYSDRFQYAANIILSFQGTTMCQKILNDVCHNRKDTSLHLALNAERMELGNNILNSSKRSTTCDMVVDNASNHSEELKVTSLAKFDSLELAENCIFSSGGTTICQKVSSDAFYHPKDNDLSPSLSLSLIVMLTEHFLLGYLGKLSISASGIPK